MYTVTTGIHIHFAHHVRGHLGPCISLHGHTWLFQVTLAARALDHQGFVADFDILHEKVLAPCHALLDHSLALGEESYREVESALVSVGSSLVASRQKLHGHLGQAQPMYAGPLSSARNEKPGGIKVCVFPFTPTSERIAEWLFGVTQEHMGDERVLVQRARIYETLHPVESYADFVGPTG
jgi:6-pyruvoyl-tetrahydropterin synthase